jgi:subtilisin family serine protease
LSRAFHPKNSPGEVVKKALSRLPSGGSSKIKIVLFPLILTLFLNCDVSAALKSNTIVTALNRRGIGINPDKLALPGVVVIKLKPGVAASIQELLKVPELEGRILKEANPRSVQSVAEATKMKLDKSSEILSDIYIVNYSGTVTPAMMAQTLLKNPDVVYAEPHYIYKVEGEEFTSNDSLLSQQYALTNIQAYQAWGITIGSSSVPIGIVDTGVDWMHPNLYGNIWHNPHWQTDANYPADSIGWDFGGAGTTDADGNYIPTPDNNPMEDFPTHGTHVAGIAAAIAVNSGIAGVAPGCKIMAVKVSQENFVDQSGEPYIAYGFEGIIYAVDNGARVINCSWGGPGYSQYEQDVVNYATAEGTLIVAAAGNDYHSAEFFTPAYYDNVLSVAATDQNDNATDFTNVNYNISVSAPGLNIISTWGTNTYATLSGTSMASPCAAGVAALVVSQHPEYTSQQVLEQVRVSADNIDAINPGLAHQIGFGRVNAYRALTVSSPGVDLSNIVLIDSAGGKLYGAASDGETLQVSGTLTNWLAPTSNLQVTLTSSDPYVTILNGTVSVGSLTTKGSYDVTDNQLSFRISGDVPADHVAQLLILMKDGSYSDYKGFTVVINPTYSELALNNIMTTINALGNIGFNDYPNNLEGIGFVYKPDGNDLLFEGAFMAGTSSTKEVDVARDSSGDEESADFRREGFVPVRTPGTVADQEASTAFNDSNATFNRLGIDVSLHTYSYNKDSTSNFIILEYRIHNLNSAALNNFYGGLFFDWDISPYEDIASYDEKYQLGFAYDSTRIDKTYVGCALLYGATPSYTAINNDDPNTGANTGFTKSRKWNALSGKTGITHVGPADISMVVSGGPLVIPGNSDTVLAFVIAAGDTLSDLETAVKVAQETYDTITHVAPLPIVPTIAKLYQNYPNPFPNPFNPTTTITFDLKDNARVTVDVFNVIGERVATLTDKDYQAQYDIQLKFSAGNFASGVYFVRLTAVSKTGTYVQTKKMMVLK